MAIVVVLIGGVSVLSAKEPAAARSEKRVLIIGMDGTRPDALAKAKTPTIDRLIKEGAFTDNANILGDRYQKNDTISGPGWSSILTGVWADKHGVHDNNFKGKNYELFPHFFKRLKRERPDAKTASLVSWEPIHEHILSEADIAEVFPLPRGKNQTADLRISADKIDINTRDGKWHHLLASRSQDQLKLYLDGRLIGSLEGVDLEFPLGGDFYYLGRDSRSGATGLNGQLDDVRLWKRTLTDEEIAQAAAKKTPVNRQGLLAEYLLQGDLKETAGNPEGPFTVEPITKDASVRYGKASTDAELSFIDCAPTGNKTHGVKVPLNDPLRDLTRGDYTIEARFKTQDKGRNILMGNYDGKAGALNLELHENNSVRVYFQPADPKNSGALEREGIRDQQIAARAAQILREEDPTALFVYFHQTDATGHAIGFSPEVPEYIKAIENIDARVNTLLKAMQSRPNYDQEDWLIIVCTDHGGLKRSHSNGLKVPEIRRVFLILHGPSVQPGPVKQQAYLVDVTGTALTHLLGHINPQWQIDGKAVGLKSTD